MSSAWQVRIHASLEELDPAAWNRLNPGHDPFLRHEFLVALERHGCVGAATGWTPQHIALYDPRGTLLGATPLYRKSHSYGELVFDWAWADAAQRNGIAYYPKLVAAIPYTPATGSRLLTAPGIRDAKAIQLALARAAVDLARDSGCGSVHWLFPPEDELDALQPVQALPRSDCQFHWENAGYQDFDEFLAALSSAKRKKIRRERRRVREAGIELEYLDGHQIDAPQWAEFHRIYASTFERKSGYATLTLPFFQEIGRTLPEAVVLVRARHQGRTVAAAFNIRGPDTLYGRHWGCFEQYHSLHFEACYYAGLEYCIDQGLARFEPGAQGEHKISRGFLPHATWSAHWIAHPGLATAIDRYLVQERDAMEQYREELNEHSPYRKRT